MQMGMERFLAMALLTTEGRSEYIELKPTPPDSPATRGFPSEVVALSLLAAVST